jgi:hypothetical protein
LFVNQSLVDGFNMFQHVSTHSTTVQKFRWNSVGKSMHPGRCNMSETTNEKSFSSLGLAYPSAIRARDCGKTPWKSSCFIVESGRTAFISLVYAFYRPVFVAYELSRQTQRIDWTVTDEHHRTSWAILRQAI